MKRRNFLRALCAGVSAVVAAVVVPKAKATEPELSGGMWDNKPNPKWVFGDGSGALQVYTEVPSDLPRIIHDTGALDGPISFRIEWVRSVPSK